MREVKGKGMIFSGWEMRDEGIWNMGDGEKEGSRDSYPRGE
jgi:hypothetical protein